MALSWIHLHAGDLSAFPAPAPAPAAHQANSSGKSLFVIEALLATFTRSSAESLQGTLELQSVSNSVTWFSGEGGAPHMQSSLTARPCMQALSRLPCRCAETPKKTAGRMSSTKVAGQEFYAVAGEQPSQTAMSLSTACLQPSYDVSLWMHAADEHGTPSAGKPTSWLDNANFALYAPKNNASATESVFIFGINSAPVLSEGGSVWRMDVTMIPSTTESIYGTAGVTSFSAASFPMVSTFAPVSLFVDDICYLYNRWVPESFSLT
jgi:hypothetical protein